MMDNRLKKLIEHIRQYSFSLLGFAEGEKYSIPLENILYIESVDGRTFLYCQDKVYEYKETLTSLDQRLLHTSFVRISKSCIMNLNALKCVKSFLNHRMEATLTTGEELMVSRNYIEQLKKKLEE
jgi:DNA-binding LytR/AlgR family response regulator